LIRELARDEAAITAKRAHLAELNKSLAAVPAPMPAEQITRSFTGRKTQFQMIIDYLREHSDGRTREQIIDALRAEIATASRNPKKAIITAISSLKAAGDIELYGKEYRVTDKCSR